MVVWKRKFAKYDFKKNTCSQQKWFKILFYTCVEIVKKLKIHAKSNSQPKVKSSISICMQCVFTHNRNKN